MLRLTSLAAAAALGLLASSCGGTLKSCNLTTCTGGCCTADDQCVDGNALSACGIGGNACNVCSGSQTCFNQACVILSGTGGGTADGGLGGGTASGGGAAGTGGGGGTSSFDAGLVLTTPLETWTWVDFPDAVCGNGQSTGVGVNRTTRSTDLFIYLEGGGACWDATSCFLLQSAANLSTGYTASTFATDPFPANPFLSRDNVANPFRAMSYVYVPYCTGDVHAGNAVKAYDATHGAVYHKGGKNLEAYLYRLAATFRTATRVFLVGSSAGAYGAQFNYARVAAAFPYATVHVLADCGQLVNPTGSLLSTWVTNWNVTFPAACTSCSTDFTAYADWLIKEHPASRIGLLAYERDSVLTLFFGYGGDQFTTLTDTLVTTRYDGRANARYFVLPDAKHVMFPQLSTITSVDGGVGLLDWVDGWVDGTSAWVDTRP